MHLFFSVGEPSGDQHAAHLMEALRARDPQARFSGFGGPLMAQAGLEELYRLSNLAVMGLVGIAPLLGTFFRLLKQADEFLKQNRPDGVVLIDYPGFNWWIARKAKQLGIPVYYYCAPQLWAWGGWRIHKMRKLVDCVLSVLPFEAEWFAQQGLRVEYVGHPFFDEAARHQLQTTATIDGPNSSIKRFDYLTAAGESPSRLVGILPGSRDQEVRRNFPTMIEAMRRLSAQHPDLRFAVACYKEAHRATCQQLLQDHQGDELPVTLLVGQTPEIVAWSECVLMVSGSVSLELLARGTPAVVTYRGGTVMWLIAMLLIKCPYASLPNLIAGRELFPEVLYKNNPEIAVERIVKIMNNWLSNPAELAAVREESLTLRDRVATTGGLARAADFFVREHATLVRRAA